ncbi:hypothetical protein EPUS_08347 [Endocarpon pusillum Z07020]|uniref:Uncharacterized protein n=1 Tax=Endocarpon pusillum (strain Z07020 / HMAS-L-300199) TaxID=1263415 RepID=U1HP19_ENDPU|nr:uncharacterized protein EPUS_08347 [Endocarpon pusillum Z07020]ERF70789.1 hypothetical protein EPUS_08347 [Endocarpon pusillum Z07020]
MKTLFALLRASPRYLQVYRTSKQTVLSHITWNQITPVVVPIALAALQQQEHRATQNNHGTLCETLENARQTTMRKSYEIPLETSRMLLQFHENVEFFISDFVVSRLPIIENYLYPETSHLSTKASWYGAASPKIGRALSQTEYSRLARAFYHLELYGSLFSRLDAEEDDTSVSEQSCDFLQSLKDWELEELLCVRDYLIERLTEYLNQVEDDFMQGFLEDEPHIIETAGPDSRWNNVDWFFSDDAHGQFQEGWLQGCLSRGLEEIRAILTADTSEARFDALGSTDLAPNPFGRALEALPTKLSPWRTCCSGNDCKNAKYIDDAEKHNAAWSWAIKGRRHPRSFPDYANNPSYTGLRRWGYMIWDYERLESLGILSQE